MICLYATIFFRVQRSKHYKSVGDVVKCHILLSCTSFARRQALKVLRYFKERTQFCCRFRMLDKVVNRYRQSCLQDLQQQLVHLNLFRERVRGLDALFHFWRQRLKIYAACSACQVPSPRSKK